MSSKRPELHKQIAKIFVWNPEFFHFDDPIHAMLNKERSVKLEWLSLQLSSKSYCIIMRWFSWAAVDTANINSNDMAKSREIVIIFIKNLPSVFYWSKVQNLRVEDNKSKDLIPHLGLAKSITQLSEDILNYFRQMISNINSKMNKKMNILFSYDALNLIYYDVEQVPK